MIYDHDDEGAPIHQVVSERKAANGRVRLLARAEGFVHGRLVKPGQIFEIPITSLKPAPEADRPPDSGRWFQLPSWATFDSPDERQWLEQEQIEEREKFAAAAVASSGSGHGGGIGKRKSLIDALMAGDKPLAPEALAAIESSGSAHGAEAKMERLKAAAAMADLPSTESE